eukprot:6597466-Prymnesium_polylepis.1
MGLNFSLLPRSSASCLSATSRRSIVLYYQEIPPRVHAAVGGGALAREARLLCGHADRHDQRDELDLRWGGRAVRDAALVGEQTRWHDAGW